MALRYALLSLLTGRPMTGYDVAKSFATSVGHVWHAPDSQIYPELRSMERDGLLHGRVVPWGPTTTKTEYRVTDAGRTALRAWLAAPKQPQRTRSPMYLMAAYLEWATPEAARDRLEEHIAFHAEQLAVLRRTRDTLTDGSHPTLAHRPDTLEGPEAVHATAFKVFAYDGMIEAAEQQIAWARRGLALVDSLTADDGSWKARTLLP